jgi:divalent metal cation (Fe/Co/Zn/Cd) transporter
MYPYLSGVIGSVNIPSGIPKDVPKTGDYLSGVIGLVVVVAGLFAFWQLISGGLKYITSNGDKGKVQEATSQMTYALTGLVIIVASVAITAIISRVLFGKWDAILSPQIMSIL